MRILQNNSTGGFGYPSFYDYNITIYSMLESILPSILQYNIDDSMTVKIQNCL